MGFIPPKVLKPRELLVRMPPLPSLENCLLICFAFQRGDEATGAILSVIDDVNNTSLPVFVLPFSGYLLYLGMWKLPEDLGLPAALYNELLEKVKNLSIFCTVFCGIMVRSPGTPLQRSPSAKRRRQGRSDLEDSAPDLAADISSIC